MAKFPKPYYRKQRKTWSVQIGRRQITLGPDQKAAFAEYHRLMASEGIGVSPSKLKACELVDLFLEHVKRHKKASTYGWYQVHLQSFSDHAGGAVVANVKPHHVSGWIDAHPRWGASTRRGAITAIKRCWAWALEEGRLDTNPLVSIKRPPMGRRAGIADEDQAKFMDAIRHAELRDFADAMIETGCRPGELSDVTAVDVAEDRGSMVVRNKLGSRIVVLTEKAGAIMTRLALASPDGPIFRNTRGMPWNRNSLRCAFREIRKRTGVAGAVPYALRHLYGTKAIERGVDSLLVAELMGHKDVTMLQQHYAHHKAETLRKAAEKATGGECGEGPSSSRSS